MSKKKILLVSPYSLMNYGGVQNQILKSKEYLQGDAFDLRIFCHGSDDCNNTPPISINFNSSKVIRNLEHFRFKYICCVNNF